MLKLLENLWKAFAKVTGAPEWIVNQVLFYFALLSVILAALNYLIKFVRWCHLRYQQRLLIRDLHPYFTPLDIDNATHYYIPTKYQIEAPSQADEPGRMFIDSPKSKLIPLFLKKAFKQDNNRYYLILADSGMGKTTFMINLYLAYKKQWSFGSIKYDIKLFPLGYPNILKKIEKIQDPENTILLLDAFDEDTEALKKQLPNTKIYY